jgi:hypothetical protein
LERADDGGHVVCAMYDNSTRDASGTDVTGGAAGMPGRVWEAQGVGTSYTAPVVAGGYPQYPIAGTNLHASDVWRQCASNELDLHCRDRFRRIYGSISVADVLPRRDEQHLPGWCLACCHNGYGDCDRHDDDHANAGEHWHGNADRGRLRNHHRRNEDANRHRDYHANSGRDSSRASHAGAVQAGKVNTPLPMR